jgi:hypothetical protein
MIFDIKCSGVFAEPKTKKILKACHCMSFPHPQGLLGEHLLASPPSRDYYYHYQQQRPPRAGGVSRSRLRVLRMQEMIRASVHPETPDGTLAVSDSDFLT